MKCPFCGAEILSVNKVCAWCGSEIPQQTQQASQAQQLRQMQTTQQMRQVQQQLNKQGCPKCGSTNITFSREKQGEVRYSNGTKVIRTTVGVCKDCGFTWNVQDPNQKSDLTWLWILGWILCFPIPLTLLVLRQPRVKFKSKLATIIVVWIVYFIIVGKIGSDKKTTEPPATKATEQSTEVTESEGKIKSNIMKLKFSRKELEINSGEKSDDSYVKANVRNKKEFSHDDVSFFSEDESIATIRYSREENGTFLYYELEGIAPGETYVYAASKDGAVESDHIKVTVTEVEKTPESVSEAAESTESSETIYTVDWDNMLPLDSVQTLFVVLPIIKDRNEIDSWLKENEEVKCHKFTSNDCYFIGLSGGSISSRSRDREGEAMDIYFTIEGDITKAVYEDHPNNPHNVEYRDERFYFDGMVCDTGEEAMQLYLINKKPVETVSEKQTRQTTSAADPEVLSDDYENINEIDDHIIQYIKRYNEANPDDPIDMDMVEPYYHHGSYHKNQVKYITEDIDVTISTGIDIYVEFPAGVEHTSEEYREIFKKYMRGLDLDLDESRLDADWDKVMADDSTTIIDFDEYSIWKSNYQGRVGYFKIEERFR